MRILIVVDKSYILLRKGTATKPFLFDQKEEKLWKATGGLKEMLNFRAFNIQSEFLTNGAFNLIKE